MACCQKLQILVLINPNRPETGKRWIDLRTSDGEIYYFWDFEQWTGADFYRDHLLLGEARIVRHDDKSGLL